jgi:hypothetical protein
VIYSTAKKNTLSVADGHRHVEIALQPSLGTRRNHVH